MSIKIWNAIRVSTERPKTIFWARMTSKGESDAISAKVFIIGSIQLTDSGKKNFRPGQSNPQSGKCRRYRSRKSIIEYDGPAKEGTVKSEPDNENFTSCFRRSPSSGTDADPDCETFRCDGVASYRDHPALLHHRWLCRSTSSSSEFQNNKNATITWHWDPAEQLNPGRLSDAYLRRRMSSFGFPMGFVCTPFLLLLLPLWLRLRCSVTSGFF